MIKSGLTERDLNTISSIFSKYPSVHLVYLFGSRAKGNYKKGSDIDMAIMNAGVIEETISRIKGDFEESSLPYLVDLVYYPSLNHVDMKEHIDRVHITVYEK
ncbi:MAG: hypothetical protein JWM14_132 [Chitinophagaceae bacterium]|nr:hypothetical protein [Chitinophagaceae bacterium]